jgi:hypothetical protein
MWPESYVYFRPLYLLSSFFVTSRLLAREENSEPIQLRNIHQFHHGTDQDQRRSLSKLS